MRARLALLLVLVSLALGGGLLPVWCARAPHPQVEVAAARRAPLRVEVSTNGKVEPVYDI